MNFSVHIYICRNLRKTPELLAPPLFLPTSKIVLKLCTAIKNLTMFSCHLYPPALTYNPGDATVTHHCDLTKKT